MRGWGVDGWIFDYGEVSSSGGLILGGPPPQWVCRHLPPPDEFLYSCIWAPKESPFIGCANSCLVAGRPQYPPPRLQALAHSLKTVLFQWEEGRGKGAGLSSTLGLLKQSNWPPPHAHAHTHTLFSFTAEWDTLSLLAKQKAPAGKGGIAAGRRRLYRYTHSTWLAVLHTGVHGQPLLSLNPSNKR